VTKLGKEVNFGKHRVRRSYAQISEVLEMPNLIEIQLDSFKWFLDQGLKDVFQDVMPIENFNETAKLEFVDYTFRAPKYNVEEARIHDANYAAPLYVNLRLTNKETGEMNEQEIFFGDFPLMTNMGTFLINGAERVIVSQLVRSPGVYFHEREDKQLNITFGSTVIPNRGAWLEYETDLKDVASVRIDRARKIPLTTLVRALGIANNEEILDIFGHEILTLGNTIAKDVRKREDMTSVEEALFDIYEKLRPGEPVTADSSRKLIQARFFDPKRYDFAKVGRYKANKKLDLVKRLENQILAEDIKATETLANEDGEIIAKKGKVLAKAGDKVTRELLASGLADAIKAGVNSITITPQEDAVLQDDITVQIFKVVHPKNPDKTLNVVGNGYIDHETLNLTPADIISSMSYFFNLVETDGKGTLAKADDIDHLGNRRIRGVGELVQNQFRIGLARMERVVKEKMSTISLENVTPSQIINPRPVTAAIREFFGSSQLSQFMDQTNPLSELSHKRRFSALGPGGLTRDRAGYEVRDVHYTHYGRLCPIETPEGPNIGLINQLSSYAKLNQYGFVQTPYIRINKAKGAIETDKNGNPVIDYLTADEEDLYTVAQADTKFDKDGKFAAERAFARREGDDNVFAVEEIDYVDVSPKQVVAIATACIPFLENDDSNRALMGANMQRQAVPLINPKSPWIGTGMEYQAAHDSGAALICEHDGLVEFSDSNEVRVRRDNGVLDVYPIAKFRRSNSGTSYNQQTLVRTNDKVEAGDVLADGPSMERGELALGQNVLVAFTTWEGYNYEDAIIMSRRLVKDDVYTSIHIEELASEVRDTKLGAEEITREIPNVSEQALKDLDARGIIRVGAEVKEGDIIVGKVTPKGVSDLTPEEQFLHAIFGEKAREVRDTSLRVPHGSDGIVSDVKVFTRENGDDLPNGVIELVRVYIIQKRKIKEGDKMAGRHGNKGVVSRIMPEEDMPYLPDGTPVDIMLNPQGVPSRMNIGQVLELHLGMAARNLNIHIATPVFDGAKGDDVWATVKEAGMSADAKTVLYDGRTGEPFDNRISVGVMYMIKLSHMVDDKLHARSIGPYSLVTQQPLGGKAQFGGQRFGEMEVWALEAYGAAHILQEILTYKSDDIDGRVKAFDSIVEGKKIPAASVPESFRVLVKELQALGLDLRVLDAKDAEIQLETDDDEIETVDALTKYAEQNRQREIAHERVEEALAEANNLENLDLDTVDDGRLYNEDGEMIDEMGNLIDEFDNIIDSEGTILVENGAQFPSRERSLPKDLIGTVSLDDVALGNIQGKVTDAFFDEMLSKEINPDDDFADLTIEDNTQDED
jgi:DNA-directed RNA polymerase subunit beta